MYGKKVERFFVTAQDSYIFKPLTNQDQIGKEVWIHDHILSVFPPIYPRIIAKSVSNHNDINWIIFEDVGHLEHRFNVDIALSVTKEMVQWHQLSIERYRDADLQAPKPLIEEIKLELTARKTEVLGLANSYFLPKIMIETVYLHLKNCTFSKELVLSHGDLHLGNFALTNKKLIILDWEHAHLNSPLWDLYHLLDMSHPLFPKSITPNTREQVLNFYIEEVRACGNKLNQLEFKQEYYLFSATVSIWMLLLIQNDLQKAESKWPAANLKKQLNETMNSLKQCIEQLRSTTSFLNELGRMG
jgi:thiamine kinase-like enzyme